ncbi:DGQHR domain-containing protein [Clostridium botulinum]|uniref:DGQHR domain-containing protein n=1 Tax=Clostridium botulinum TaxID=1491 RepID=A0A6M0V3K2_CLOBO|nr:DNA sulfur modification protein DndB [Clostridium botulinum]MCS6112591.1 DGQHR domain-containing protein [Clostridium botulinum]NFE13099.1 DGQHR domain-containing protein [Clostridium botulinum]NFE61215.1 DGQHR domain-containing protein [Clostridium botulinum]NFF87290.1 DGQHR domain-containing protein [Clostridium botulinum]NFG11349.1 DGQHR domain-containing protein [Clostridium botulinum]
MGNIIIKGIIDTIFSKDKAMMSSQMTIGDVLKVYKIDKQVNRDLAYHRLPKLIKYFESADIDIGIYLPAFVFSFRDNPINYYDQENDELTISPDHELIVLDGQHRIKALENYNEKLKNNPEKQQKFLNNNITVQIYFGLDIADERKLFTDINSNAKRVSMSLITQYDSRDILNLLIQELYQISNSLKVAKIELNKSKIMRPSNIAFCTGIRLKDFINFLLFGKKAANLKEQKQIKEQYDEIVSFLNKFFDIFFSSLPDVPGDVTKYVLGHPSIQNAIALYLNETIILNETTSIKWIDTWEEEIEQLKFINWSVKNKVWNKWSEDTNPSKGSYIFIQGRDEQEMSEYIKKAIND